MLAHSVNMHSLIPEILCKISDYPCRFFHDHSCKAHNAHVLQQYLIIASYRMDGEHENSNSEQDGERDYNSTKYPQQPMPQSSDFPTLNYTCRDWYWCADLSSPSSVQIFRNQVMCRLKHAQTCRHRNLRKLADILVTSWVLTTSSAIMLLFCLRNGIERVRLHLHN